MFSPVAAPRSPPKVMIGDRHAKYIKKNEATHCTCNASLKSLRKNGTLRFMSAIRPPKILYTHTHTHRYKGTTIKQKQT